MKIQFVIGAVTRQWYMALITLPVALELVLSEKPPTGRLIAIGLIAALSLATLLGDPAIRSSDATWCESWVGATHLMGVSMAFLKKCGLAVFLLVWFSMIASAILSPFLHSPNEARVPDVLLHCVFVCVVSGLAVANPDRLSPLRKQTLRIVNTGAVVMFLWHLSRGSTFTPDAVMLVSLFLGAGVYAAFLIERHGSLMPRQATEVELSVSVPTKSQG